MAAVLEHDGAFRHFIHAIPKKVKFAYEVHEELYHREGAFVNYLPSQYIKQNQIIESRNVIQVEYVESFQFNTINHQYDAAIVRKV